MHVPAPEPDWLHLPRAQRRTLLSHAPPAATHSTATHFFVCVEQAEVAHSLPDVQAVPTGAGAAHVPFTHLSAERQSESDVHTAPASPGFVHFTTDVALPPPLHTRPSAQLDVTEEGFDGS
jgi:hypothetical protein